MNQELEKLISLQGIDSKISDIKSLAGDLPQRVKEKEEALVNMKAELVDIEQRLDEIEKKNRKIKAETEDGQVNLNKYKDQLFLVKSNKEYDALNQEIDHLKNILSESEEKYISFETKKEELLETKKVNETDIESLDETLVSERKKLDLAFQDSNAELEELSKEREKIANHIDPLHMKTYDKLRNARGFGVAALIDSCCGSCYSTLPPQTVVEIKSNDILLSCPSCSVYLYWEEEEAEE